MDKNISRPQGKKCVFKDNNVADITVKLRTKNKKGSSLMHATKTPISKSDTLLSDSDTSSDKEVDSSVDSLSESSDTDHREAKQPMAGTSTTQNIQVQILKELQRVSSRLEVVENKVADTAAATQDPKKDTRKLSSFSKSKMCQNIVNIKSFVICQVNPRQRTHMSLSYHI